MAGAALAQGALDQPLELAHIAGEVVGLQAPHRFHADVRGLAPAEAAGFLAHAVADPLAQIGAAHPQGRNADLAAEGVEGAEARLGGEEQPSRETVPPGGILGVMPVAVAGQLQQLLPQGLGHQIELIDQQGASAQTVQQWHLLSGAAAEQIGAVGPQQGAVEPDHQLLAVRRAEMDQRGDVVLLQAWFAADQHGPALGIQRGVADLLPQPAGVAAAADDAAPRPRQQQRRQAQQAAGIGFRRGGGLCCRPSAHRRNAHRPIAAASILAGMMVRPSRSFR